VRKVALSPDGIRALSRTSAGRVQLWELATGRELRAFDVAFRRVLAVAFSPDGRLALTGRKLEESKSGINTRACLWEVETGREIQTFGGFGAEIESATFSPDGHRLLTAGYERMASVWDVDSGRRLLTLKGHLHGLKGAAFSPGNRIIVSGGQDDTVKLWDADGGQLLRTLETGDTVEALAVSPDGRFILTGGDDRTLKLWDLTVGQELRTFSGHEGAVTTIQFSPDGRLVVSAGSDRKTRLWDVATGREIRAWKEDVPLHAVAISPDGHLLATAGSERVAIWRIPGWQEVARLTGIGGTLRTVAFSPDGQLILGGTETGAVRLWELASGKIRHAWKHQADVRGVLFTPDGRLAISSSFDGTVAFHDVTSGAVVRTLRAELPEQIGAVALSGDGRWLATGNDAKLVRLWDLRGGRPVRLFRGHLGDVRAVAFSPDGALLFSASRDHTLRVWDVASGQQLHEYAWASDAIRSFALSPDGRRALVGNDDGSMNLWDFSYLRNERTIAARLPAARAALQVRPDDGAALATLGEWYAFRGVSSWAIDLFGRARAGGTPIGSLVLGRSYWQEGEFARARTELERARAERAAPPDYLDTILPDLRPSDQATRLTELSQRDGRVRLPFLGIRSGTLGKGPTARGAQLSHVFPRSPAYEVGLRVGDVIVNANDQVIRAALDLERFVASQSPGTAVALTFARNGEPLTVRVTLAERPVRLWEPDPLAVHEGRSGFDLQALTPELARTFGLDPSTQGVLLTNKEAHPSADISRYLHFEDIIVKIAGRPVSSALAAAAELAALPLERWNEITVIRPGHAQ
jgi:WD40 repeat protein